MVEIDSGFIAAAQLNPPLQMMCIQTPFFLLTLAIASTTKHGEVEHGRQEDEQEEDELGLKSVRVKTEPTVAEEDGTKSAFTIAEEYERSQLPDLLRVYYTRIFPYDKYFRWLQYGEWSCNAEFPLLESVHPPPSPTLLRQSRHLQP